MESQPFFLEERKDAKGERKDAKGERKDAKGERKDAKGERKDAKGLFNSMVHSSELYFYQIH